MMRGLLRVALVALCCSVASSADLRYPLHNQTPNDAKGFLMSKAKPVDERQLNNNNYAVDISQYVVKFMKCQFVKSYDDELAAEEGSSTVLATRRFVVFRLCPYGKCNSCNYGYGEYTIDLDDYLAYAIQYQQELQETECKLCEQYCLVDDANAQNNNQNYYEPPVDCNECVQTCTAIQNMEQNGYVDAANYLQCQRIYDGNDDNSSLYAGAMCSNNGEKIKIGVFSDEECTVHTSKEVDDYMEYDGNGNKMQLSYGTIKSVYDAENCITCEKVDQNANQNNNNNGNNYAETNEFCQGIYQEAAKCESAHNFADGYANYNNYKNQAAQEGVVCNFISSLSSGTYDETGEIRIGSGASSSSRGASTSGAQKFFLSVFILGTVGLAVYAAMLHQQLTKGTPPAGLAAKDGDGTLA